jgi:hypothetical protein
MSTGIEEPTSQVRPEAIPALIYQYQSGTWPEVILGIYLLYTSIDTSTDISTCQVWKKRKHHTRTSLVCSQVDTRPTLLSSSCWNLISPYDNNHIAFLKQNWGAKLNENWKRKRSDRQTTQVIGNKEIMQSWCKAHCINQSYITRWCTLWFCSMQERLESLLQSKPWSFQSIGPGLLKNETQKVLWLGLSKPP